MNFRDLVNVSQSEEVAEIEIAAAAVPASDIVGIRNDACARTAKQVVSYHVNRVGIRISGVKHQSVAEGFVERRFQTVISRVSHVVAVLNRTDGSAYQVWIRNSRACCSVRTSGRSVAIERSLIQVAKNRKMRS